MTTEKRKQQNANSQAAFRARRKEKIAALLAAISECMQCKEKVKQWIKDGEK